MSEDEKEKSRKELTSFNEDLELSKQAHNIVQMMINQVNIERVLF